MNKEMIKSVSIEKFSEKDGDQRTFSGWLSTYKNEDREGDIFEQDAFKEAIEKRDTYPLLFNHKTMELDAYIGEFKAIHKSKGVWVEATLYENDANADKVYQLLKSGALQEMSIGFGIEDYDKDLEIIEGTENNWFPSYRFKKAYIREGSVVTTPANPQATIQEVKNLGSKNTEVNFDLDGLKEFIGENLHKFINVKNLTDDEEAVVENSDNDDADDKEIVEDETKLFALVDDLTKNL